MAMNFGRVAASLAGGVIAGAGQGLIEEAKELRQARRDEATRGFQREERVAGEEFRSGESEKDRGARRDEADTGRTFTDAQRRLKEEFDANEGGKKRAHDVTLKQTPQAETPASEAVKRAQAKWYNERGTSTGRDPEAMQLIEQINALPEDDPRRESLQKRLDYLTTRGGGSGTAAADKDTLNRIEKLYATGEDALGAPTGIDREKVADHLEQMGRPDLARIYDPQRGREGSLPGFGVNPDVAANRDAERFPGAGNGPDAPPADQPRTAAPPAQGEPRGPAPLNRARETLRENLPVQPPADAPPADRPATQAPPPARREPKTLPPAPKRVRTQADYDALRSGEPYIAPDGSYRRKP